MRTVFQFSLLKLSCQRAQVILTKCFDNYCRCKNEMYV